MPWLACLIGIVLVSFAAGAPAAAADRNQPKYEKFEEGPVYLRLDRIMIPVIQKDEVQKLVTVILVMEFVDPAARDRAKVIMPRLMDAFRRDLHVLASRPSGSEEEIDLAVAKRYLVASGDRVLGPHTVKDVLIERIFVRKPS